MCFPKLGLNFLLTYNIPNHLLTVCMCKWLDFHSHNAKCFSFFSFLMKRIWGVMSHCLALRRTSFIGLTVATWRFVSILCVLTWCHVMPVQSFTQWDIEQVIAYGDHDNIFSLVSQYILVCWWFYKFFFVSNLQIKQALALSVIMLVR